MNQVASSSSRAKYVYCIIRTTENKSFGKIGIGTPSPNVYTIVFKNLGVVVSDTSFIRYEPNEENALAHERVVEKVMEDHTVLPVRFGTIFKDEKNMRTMLLHAYSQFLSELRRLDGKVEIGLKVFWKPHEAIREAEKNPSIQRLMEATRSQSKGLAYLMQKKLDESVKAELNRQADAYSNQIYRTVRKRTMQAKLLKPIGHMILNATFLVSKETTQALRDEVNKLKKELEPKGAEFLISGPWPAYNFVTLKYQ